MKKRSAGISYRKLISHAQKAKRYSYSPYSKFRVGAALLTTDGKIYTGCNIENSSYGLTICAERTAIFNAISQGARKFRALAIVSDYGDFTPPCGACRQVLMDLASNIDLIFNNRKGEYLVVSLNELLPMPFLPVNLHQTKTKRS